MKQVLTSNRGVHVEAVSAPQVSQGSVLVRVVRSCISVGTEMRGVRSTQSCAFRCDSRHLV